MRMQAITQWHSSINQERSERSFLTMTFANFAPNLYDQFPGFRTLLKTRSVEEWIKFTFTFQILRRNTVHNSKLGQNLQTKKPHPFHITINITVTTDQVFVCPFLESLGLYCLLLASLHLTNHVLQRSWWQPKCLHQVVLAVAHKEAKGHICDVVAPKKDPGETNKNCPEHDKDTQWSSKDQVGQQKTGAHSSPSSMAWWEGVAVHRERGKHVHAVMGRTPATHHGFNYGH